MPDDESWKEKYRMTVTPKHPDYLPMPGSQTINSAVRLSKGYEPEPEPDIDDDIFPTERCYR